MAEDNDAVLAAAKRLPFAERAAHKAWFVRAAGYEDIAADCSKALDPSDPIFTEVGEAHYHICMCIMQAINEHSQCLQREIDPKLVSVNGRTSHISLGLSYLFGSLWDIDWGPLSSYEGISRG